MAGFGVPFLAVLTVLVCMFGLAPAPAANRRPVPAPSWKLSASVTQKVMAKCGKVDGKCKSQPKEVAKRRQSLKASIVKQSKRKDSDVEEAFKRTYMAKKALYKLQGLENVEPADNGMWAQDLILNAKQAKYLENFYKSGGKVKVSAPPPPPANKTSKTTGKKRGKRSHGMRFDIFPINKWGYPTPVLVDPSFSKEQAAEVHRALDAIESSTCIRFAKLYAPPGSGDDYMHIIPYDASNSYGCGAAQVGRQEGGASLVYIGVGGSCSNTYGLTLHETMHCLGYHHEHQRYDRDQYIKILYTEQDPWYMDNLAPLPPDTTTYWGTAYDYTSVMHYPLYLGLFELVPGMGGEQYESEIGYMKGLSKSDIDGLKRAYCAESNCNDGHPDCPYWDTMNGFCDWKKQTGYPVEQYCPKTCGFCK